MSVRPEMAKTLGLIWIKCPYPILSLGLEATLEAEARVHRGDLPPAVDAPSCVLLCPTIGDDVASQIATLRAQASDAPTLVFGVPSDDLWLARAVLRAGARGLIDPTTYPEQTIHAVSAVLKGELVFPRKLLETLLSEDEESLASLWALEPRTLEVLALVAERLTIAQIARRLRQAEPTVKQHLRRAYEELGVRNRTEAAKLLRETASSRGWELPSANRKGPQGRHFADCRGSYGKLSSVGGTVAQ